MTKEQYLEQRNELMAAIEKLIAEGKTDEADAKMKEVEDLDNKWEDIKLANANMNALKDKTKAADITAKTEKMEGGTIVDDNKTVTADVDETKVYENAWAKSLQGKTLEGDELTIFNKMNAGLKNDYTHTTINTPTLIPETVVAGIWSRAEELYPFLADVKKYNVRGILTINTHDSIAAGDATWYDEDDPVADEENVFGQIQLSGCELAKSITVSWKMRSMAIEEFIPFIKRELGTRVGVVLGTAVLQGSGAFGSAGNLLTKKQPLGLETALEAENDTPQVVTYSTSVEANYLSYDKIVEAIGNVHSTYLPGCAFYANSSTIWNKLATLKDGENRPIFIPDPTAGGVGRMLGFVVKADAGVSTDNIVFGNPGEAYVMNTNEPMSLATEEHAKARTVDYVAYMIVDGTPLDTKAFSLIKKS